MECREIISLYIYVRMSVYDTIVYDSNETNEVKQYPCKELLCNIYYKLMLDTVFLTIPNNMLKNLEYTCFDCDKLHN